MNLTVILLTAGFLNVCAKGVSQNVTFSGQDVSLESVFSSIKQQTGFVFMYKVPVLQSSKPVSISAQNVPLEQFLKEVFKSQPLKYNIKGKSIFISRKEAGSSDRQLSNGTFDLLQDTLIDVRGRIINEKGEPVVASVIIKGTNRGITSNANGEFELNNVDNNAVLIITGTNIETIQIDAKKELSITIKTIATALAEIVINKGYYSEKQKLNVGSVSKINAVEIERQPVSNPLAAMIGKVPGLSISQYTGVPGDGFRVLIRDRNSISSVTRSEPLYIVDGIQIANSSTFLFSGTIMQGPSMLNSINPNDIENIEALKDADATSIYGSRGANGVILITTKKGKAGKTSVDINAYSGVGKVTRMLPLLNTQQYISMRKEAFANDGINPSSSNAIDLLLWDTTRYTDWQEELIGGAAEMSNLQTSISGGNDNTQFIFSNGFNRQTTVFPGDFSYIKATSLLNLNHLSTNKKFRLNVSFNYASDKNRLPTTDFTPNAVSLTPNAPKIYNSDGSLNWENSTWINPLAETKKDYTLQTRYLRSNIIIGYKILNNLEFSSNIGYSTLDMHEKRLEPISSQNPDGAGQTGSAIKIKGYTNTWIIEPQINYNIELGNHKMSALAGSTFQETVREAQGFFSTGYISDTQLENIDAATSISPSGIPFTQYRLAALYSRLNYNFKDKYILNITGRTDGSSRFGPNKRFGHFGAVGAAWLFSNENWVINNVSVISFGKLRANYGSSGSDQIPDYGYLDTYSSTSYNYNGGKGLYPTRLFNPDFAWEINKKLEIGIDFGFLGNRINLNTSFYTNKSSNQLVGFSLPAITGFASVQSNFPAIVRNQGFEVSLNTENIKTKNGLNWSSIINLTVSRNKLLSYPNIEASSYAQSLAVGKSLYIRKKYISSGVDSETGIYKFMDVDGNGSLSLAADGMFLKTVASKYYGNFSNSISFKGFSLDFNFQFVNQLGLGYIPTTFQAPGRSSNQLSIVLNRWQKPGDNTSIQRFGQGGAAQLAYNTQRISGDGVYDNASFIRLKNISISYNVPESIIRKAYLKNLRFYCDAQNLLTITNYYGGDPEVQNIRVLPPLKMITVGLQVKF